MVLSSEQWLALLVGMAVLLYAAGKFFYGAKNTPRSFLVSNKSVSFPLSAISPGIAWVWAPALFVSSQRAYQQGIAGLLWFSIPNALCLAIFAFLAVRMLAVYPQGTTLPEFMGMRFGSRMETLFSVSITVVQGYAVIVNLTAAILLLGLVTGMSRDTLVLILGTMMVTLSMARGIRSSFVADCLKAGMVLMVLVIIVPLIVGHEGVGLSGIWDGHGGNTGKFTSLLDGDGWTVAWTFGIPLAISLWAGVIIDQQQWQRAFSTRKGIVLPSWLLAGVVFLTVPLALGALGLIAANPEFGIQVKQPQLSGFQTVNHFLPTAGVVAFTLMIVAGLVAAGASALNAFSSIGAISLWKRHAPNASDGELLTVSRVSMVALVAVGMYVAHLPSVQIVYLVLLIGAFRGSLMIPTILALFWSRLSEKWTFAGILTGMVVGVTLFLYGNSQKDANIASFGILVPVVITLAACTLGTWLSSRQEFSFRKLSATPGRIAES